MHDKRDHIINGHVPVHRLRGESPVKCDGRVIAVSYTHLDVYKRQIPYQTKAKKKVGEACYGVFKNR